jgi:hypothetical protein
LNLRANEQQRAESISLEQNDTGRSSSGRRRSENAQQLIARSKQILDSLSSLPARTASIRRNYNPFPTVRTTKLIEREKHFGLYK